MSAGKLCACARNSKPRRLDAPAVGTELKSASSWWLVGGNISLADVAVYHMLSTPTSLVSGSAVSFFDNEFVNEGERVRAAFVSCPRLSACVAAVGALTTVQVWEEETRNVFVTFATE